jgi:hypothetical protein
VHAATIIESAFELDGLIRELSAKSDPIAEADRLIDAELESIKDQLKQHKPERVVELARIACLPWSTAGETKPETEGGLVKTELLALLALTSPGATADGNANEQPNELYEAAHRWGDAVSRLVQLHEARLLLKRHAGPRDDLELISLQARSREVWIRNSSYPDMVEITHKRLFAHKSIPKALSAALGFDEAQARVTLRALDELQTSRMNERVASSVLRLSEAAQRGGHPSETLKQQLLQGIKDAWQPTADKVAFSPEEVAAAAGLDVPIVSAVLDHFSVDLGALTSREALDGFIVGDNPLRSNPVVRTARGQSLLVHSALIEPAIRERLEEALKGLTVWEEYAKWRGDLLEEIGKIAFETLLPGATTHLGFEYFVPASEAEAALAPEKYTKLVEGDLLFLLDDVAIVAEAKAVAIIPAARAGETRKLRRNLTDIITKASEQATRLSRRIEDDRGIRLRSGAWLDLAHIREIHTVALSLEDLPGVSTATSDLIAAGLLAGDEIPWVVSVHDLQTIAELVDRPAEFLLYLRRRRNREVSLAYSSPDELDLFLYFYESGLYVAPDPKKMVAELPHLHEPRTSDLRRRSRQRLAFISSRTDSLDAWHYARLDPGRPVPPKPKLTGSPLTSLVDEIQAAGYYGWLSLGATLLSGSTKAQSDWSGIPKRLFAKSRRDGHQHSQTIPVGETLPESWVLTWMSQPKGGDLDELATHARRYIRAKKYQLGFPRAAALLFDAGPGTLATVLYDGSPLTSDEATEKDVERLFPVEALAAPPPPSRRRSGSSARKRKKRRNR